MVKLKTGTGKGGQRQNGGRTKGSRNRLTREVAIALSEDGKLTPLEYMLKVMRDDTADEDRRDRMAIGAAPFMHARLQAIQHSGKDGGAIQVTFTPLDAGAL